MSDAPPPAVDDPRIYLAAERTYLSWVRTSLGLMGFGFLIARFGFLIRGLEGAEAVDPRYSPFAPILGGAIVVFGVCVCLTAASRHRAYVAALRGGVPNPELTSRAPLVVAAVLATAGLAMTAFILSSTYLLLTS